MQVEEEIYMCLLLDIRFGGSSLPALMKGGVPTHSVPSLSPSRLFPSQDLTTGCMVPTKTPLHHGSLKVSQLNPTDFEVPSPAAW